MLSRVWLQCVCTEYSASFCTIMTTVRDLYRARTTQMIAVWSWRVEDRKKIRSPWLSISFVRIISPSTIIHHNTGSLLGCFLQGNVGLTRQFESTWTGWMAFTSIDIEWSSAVFSSQRACAEWRNLHRWLRRVWYGRLDKIRTTIVLPLSPVVFSAQHMLKKQDQQMTVSLSSQLSRLILWQPCCYHLNGLRVFVSIRWCLLDQLQHFLCRFLHPVCLIVVEHVTLTKMPQKK